MAMENMGAIAGTASSVQGFTTVTIGALIGAGIGQAFDGTTVPMFLGFFVAGLIALAIVALVEPGRLFRPTWPSFHRPAREPAWRRRRSRFGVWPGGAGRGARRGGVLQFSGPDRGAP